jgi:hypothetical protein
VFDGAPYPSWYDSPAGGADGIEGHMDNPAHASNDFIVTIEDNIDDSFPAGDPTRDNDLKIFVKSSCTKFADAPVALIQLVEVRAARQQYEQEGRGQDKTGFAGTQ